MKPFVIKRDGYLFGFVKTFSSKSNSEIRSMDFCQFVRLFIKSTLWAAFFTVLAFGVCTGAFILFRDLGEIFANAYDFIPYTRATAAVWENTTFYVVFGLIHAILILGNLYLLYLVCSWIFRKVRSWIPKPNKVKQQSFLSAAYDSVKHKYCIPLEFK